MLLICSKVFMFLHEPCQQKEISTFKKSTHWSSAITPDHSSQLTPRVLPWKFWFGLFQPGISSTGLLLRGFFSAFYKFRPLHRAQLQSPLCLLSLSHPGMVRVSSISAFQGVFFKGFSSKSAQSRALLTQPAQQRSCSTGMLLHPQHRCGSGGCGSFCSGKESRREVPSVLVLICFALL